VVIAELKKFGIHDDPDTCYVQNPIGSTKSRLSLIPTLEMAMECEPFFAIARRKIFHPWQSIGGLAELMGGTAEGRIVNWTKLDNEDGSARTIEFRQHQGTLEIESVKWWVEFCAGLLRLAERNARVGHYILYHLESLASNPLAMRYRCSYLVWKISHADSVI